MAAPTDPANTVTFVPTAEDTLAAYRLRYRLRPLHVIGGAFVTAAFIALLNSISDTPPKALFFAVPIAIATYGLIVVVLRRVVFPRQIRKIYRQQAALHKETVFAWDAAGLHGRTDRGAGTMPWNEYIGRRENAEVILLYHSDALFQFIPRRILNEAQQAELATYIAAIPTKR